MARLFIYAPFLCHRSLGSIAVSSGFDSFFSLKAIHAHMPQRLRPPSRFLYKLWEYRQGYELTYLYLCSFKRFSDLCIPLYIQLNQKTHITQTHVPNHVYSSINIGCVEPAQQASRSHAQSRGSFQRWIKAIQMRNVSMTASDKQLKGEVNVHFVLTCTSRTWNVGIGELPQSGLRWVVLVPSLGFA